MPLDRWCFDLESEHTFKAIFFKRERADEKSAVWVRDRREDGRDDFMSYTHACVGRSDLVPRSAALHHAPEVEAAGMTHLVRNFRGGPHHALEYLFSSHTSRAARFSKEEMIRHGDSLTRFWCA